MQKIAKYIVVIECDNISPIIPTPSIQDFFPSEFMILSIPCNIIGKNMNVTNSPNANRV